MATLVRHDRPRDLKWYLAGPLFFGDLGTSRLYVLGLAFFYAGMAAPWYAAGICALVAVVGWAYTVVCRVNPDGGGVYSSGRLIHPTLGAVGAFLLFANYVVTAAISTYEAIVYIGVPLGLDRAVVPVLSVLAILGIGALNYIGPKRAGTFALFVAVASITVTAILALAASHHLPRGWSAFLEHGELHDSPKRVWLNLVAVVLALSGVESIANMTGIMVPPVKRTAKLSIYPVITEVVLLNLVLVFIACSLPGLPEIGVIAEKHEALQAWEALPPELKAGIPAPPEITPHEHAVTEHILEVLARTYVNPLIPNFSVFASVIFGMLLLSATNTAVIAMISIQYAMSRNGDLPGPFSRLNRFGVPWYGLIGACALPAVVVLLTGNVQTLAKLYAIGVVGAIAINLGSCALNRRLDIGRLERPALWLIGGVMAAIWITIGLTNVTALLFLVVMLSVGMSLRALTRVRPPVPVPAPAAAAPAAAPAPTAGPPFDPSKGRILVATQRNVRLLRFAFDEARRRDANLFVLFVRSVAGVLPVAERPWSPEEDAGAAKLFARAEEMAREYNVPLQRIYCVNPSPGDVILDFAATYAADLVILGVSRRASVLRALRGDVIATVADHLPAESTLLIHA